MDVRSAITRAKRGLREERRLYVVAVSSLAVAFLCLGTALLGIANLDVIAERWGQSGRLTVYLNDGADPQDIAQLRVTLEGLSDVLSVEHVTPEMAQAEFVEHSDIGADLGTLPSEVFPASLDVRLVSGADRGRAAAIAERIGQFRAVSDVESYRGWFEKLDGLLLTARGVGLGVALLVAFCVIAVIANTIRLAVARRRREIQVMKLCGATDGFVRGPFVLEGMFQGFLAALASVVVLLVAYLALRGSIDGTLAALAGGRIVFLSVWTMLGLVFGGAVVGALGSALSVRRYLLV